MKQRQVIGWRENVELPDLAVDRIRVKVDTGARSSALHAFDIENTQRDGDTWLRFRVHPIARNETVVVDCEAMLFDERVVRSSNGSEELRPVIRTPVRLGDAVWTIEVTLTARDVMGFRMLLGREALRRRFLVDPGASFVLSGDELRGSEKKR